jgi:hypothetical protein
VSGDKFLSAGI